MIQPWVSKVTNHLLNIRGWRTDRRIVVIESDDWGSVRMPSKAVYTELLKERLPVDTCAYNSNDTLECNDDLEQLFEVLDSFRDKHGRPAIFTANNIVANPDFDRIKAAGFTEYYYEPFYETLKRYPSHDKVMDLYKEGMRKGLLKPQFHGREHLHVKRWMKRLRDGDSLLRRIFELGMFTVNAKYAPHYTAQFMDAFGQDSPEETKEQEHIIDEGLNLFNRIWGFPSRSFIAPCNTYSSELLPVLSRSGVRYIQGMVNQLQPVHSGNYSNKRIYHHQGEKAHEGLRYLVRNVFFEPSLHNGIDWLDNVMYRVSAAFTWNKPAIISSHRVNYSGFIQPRNRENNLRLLKQILRAISKRWPEVEFMSSDELGDLMEKS